MLNQFSKVGVGDGRTARHPPAGQPLANERRHLRIGACGQLRNHAGRELTAVAVAAMADTTAILKLRFGRRALRPSEHHRSGEHQAKQHRS